MEFPRRTECPSLTRRPVPAPARAGGPHPTLPALVPRPCGSDTGVARPRPATPPPESGEAVVPVTTPASREAPPAPGAHEAPFAPGARLGLHARGNPRRAGHRATAGRARMS